MRKPIALIVGAGLAASPALAQVASPALAQVRPQDCRPVLPIVDPASAMLPQDVIAEPAAPAVAASRRFAGLPFLLPALLAAGGAGAIAAGSGGGDGGNPSVSPG